MVIYFLLVLIFLLSSIIQIAVHVRELSKKDKYIDELKDEILEKNHLITKISSKLDNLEKQFDLTINNKTSELFKTSQGLLSYKKYTRKEIKND